jgi:hypothetical protein
VNVQSGLQSGYCTLSFSRHVEVIYSDDEITGETDSEAEGEKKPLSKKKQHKLNRLTVSV